MPGILRVSFGSSLQVSVGSKSGNFVTLKTNSPEPNKRLRRLVCEEILPERLSNAL